MPLPFPLYFSLREKHFPGFRGGGVGKFWIFAKASPLFAGDWICLSINAIMRLNGATFTIFPHKNGENIQLFPHKSVNKIKLFPHKNEKS